MSILTIKKILAVVSLFLTITTYPLQSVYAQEIDLLRKETKGYEEIRELIK
jgi:hypothetical protein